MSKLSADMDNYEKTRKYLLGLGVDAKVISYLDRLESSKKEKLSLLIPEIVEDETLHVLALLDKDMFKDFLDSQRLLKKEMLSNNIVPFPLN